MKQRLFTKKMKKTHTILLPEMLEYHSGFLQAAFQGSGYQFEVMHSSKSAKDKSLKYISHDYCYPGVLIIGQVLELLETKRYSTDKVAFMEPQAGGACRAGNYYHVIIQTLKKCGHEHIPVISLNFKGQEKHPGFTITPKLLSALITAVCCGDLMMNLYHQVKPFECSSGTTDRIYREIEQKIMKRIRLQKGISGRQRRQNYRDIIEAFDRIPILEREKKKVGIVGEIYIKFSRLGNHNLEDQLEKWNCQCVMGGFINYAIYVVDSDRSTYMLNTPKQGVLKIYDIVLRYLNKIQQELYYEVNRHGRFGMDIPFNDLKKKAENIIGDSCITGDGWLVAAEVVAAIERGCAHILIVHPFGCLVSHICERGILQKLKQLYPHVNIQTIEYDYDSSDTLRESRILLGLSN